MDEARFLSEHVRTVWDNYDMSEESDVMERRVPKLKFDDDIEFEKMMEEVTHIKDLDREQYIREFQIKFNGNVYIFELSAHIVGRKVVGYFMEVYTPAGDGKGGKLFLFSEKI